MNDVLLQALGVAVVVFILLASLALLFFVALWLWSWHPALAVLFVMLIVCSDGEFMDMPSHV